MRLSKNLIASGCAVLGLVGTLSCATQDVSGNAAELSVEQTDLLSGKGASLQLSGLAAHSGHVTQEKFNVLDVQSCRMNSKRDCFGKYIDFVTDNAGNHESTFTFNLSPAGTVIHKLVVKAAFRGSVDILWNFQLFNVKTQAFEDVGSTAGVPDWTWRHLEFVATGDLGRFVANDEVKVRFLVANAAGEDALLDLLAVTINASAASASPGDPNAVALAPAPVSVPVPTPVQPPVAVPVPVPVPTPTSVGQCMPWKPAPADTWVWDLANAVVPSPTLNGSGVSSYDAKVYDIDLFGTSAAQIAKYHADGKKVICYVDVGSWESGRPDEVPFDPACWCGPGATSATSCSSSTHKMDGWPEYWLDVRKSSACQANIKQVINARFALAASKGCDAVEPDNVDAYDNQGGGWGITIADQYDHNLWLAQAAHANCLGVLLKNAGGLLDDGNGAATAYTAGIVAAFDFSLNEQCHQYSECGVYSAFAAAGKATFNAEYPGASAKPAYCGTAGMKTLQYNSLDVLYTNLISVCP